MCSTEHFHDTQDFLLLRPLGEPLKLYPEKLGRGGRTAKVNSSSKMYYWVLCYCKYFIILLIKPLPRFPIYIGFMWQGYGILCEERPGADPMVS